MNVIATCSQMTYWYVGLGAISPVLKTGSGSAKTPRHLPRHWGRLQNAVVQWVNMNLQEAAQSNPARIMEHTKSGWYDRQVLQIACLPFSLHTLWQDRSCTGTTRLVLLGMVALMCLNRAGGTRLLDSLKRQEIREIIVQSVDRLMHQTQYVTDRTKLRGRRNLQVLSLGAGVQSTVMALMAEHRYAGFTKPDFAIFADTGWEPKAVYNHLDWLKKQLSYPVIRVSDGNIKEDILRGVNPEGRQFIDMPVYVVKDDGKHYVGTRPCTKQYKLKPIHRYLRQHLGLKDGQLAPKDQQVDMWLGLSIDEATRVKPSKQAWITLIYPLLEKDMSRAQLYRWFKEHYPDQDLPKSACIGCPYHTDQMWVEMKENDPVSFQDAASVEWAMQNMPQSRGALTGTAYLHRARIPLNEIEFNVQGTAADAMQEECEGLCGI